VKLAENQGLRKFLFYSRGFLEHACIPDIFFQRRLEKKLHSLSQYDQQEIWETVNYYNKLGPDASVPSCAIKLSELPVRKKTGYFYDYRRVLRSFPKKSRTSQRFGDVRTVTKFPRFVKTRPIHEAHENSILLKLNSIRHFRPITDTSAYADKKDMLVWRGKVKRDHRQIAFRKLFDNPLCDIGKTNTLKDDDTLHWNKPRMTIEEQLRYKFILSIEGNEVATNLKWIAQSNSLCFMTRPKFESWFMEGRLQASKHYVEVRDDYSDLSEKMEHYLTHPNEAQAIISNLNVYFDQFRDQAKQDLISLLVVQKYLISSGQLSTKSPLHIVRSEILQPSA